ncbi:MAG TPA: TolC family protein [Pyrinomonadaceae bacterium]|jgi:HAE1 family hydrophobic/amphiphilic exporter-1
MFSKRLRAPLQTAVASLTLCATTLAQTPAPANYSVKLVAECVGCAALPVQTPTPQNPAQRDATRPPGTQQDQPNVPEQARPSSDPTRPPGTQQTAPQQPPGTRLPAPVQTPATAPPPAPTTTAPPAGEPQVPAAQPDALDQNAPVLTDTNPRPVPALPPMVRLGVQASNQLPLTLNEAIRRALENNNTIEVARNDVRFAETQLRALEGIFDPVFQYTPQLNNSVRPVSSTLAGSNQGSTVTTTDINNNFSLTKQFSRGGGNYSYFFNNTRETTNSRFTTLNPFYSASQGIQFVQPLFRDRAIDNNRRQIRIQRKRLEQSDADFRRSTIDVITQVQRAYWDLVFALRDQENQLANVKLAQQNFSRTEASVAAGAAAPLQRAEVETELANRTSSLLAATQAVSIAENNLKELLLKDPLAPDWTAALVPTDTPTFDTTPVDLTAALADARSNRPELRRQKLQQDINDIDLKYFKNQTKPQIDLTATFSTTGLAGTPAPGLATSGNSTFPLISGDPTTNADAFLLEELRRVRREAGLADNIMVPNVTVQNQTITGNLIGGYGQTLQNLFGFKTRNIVVGATIQLPLHNRTAEANLAGARIQRDQLAAQMRSQEQAIEVEVRNAAQAVETARLRVLSAREARANAELQLAGERRLYQVGRSTTFILFQRENALINARNAVLRAETDYNKALADLQRATSTTLRANNVIVESPTLQ